MSQFCRASAAVGLLALGSLWLSIRPAAAQFETPPVELSDSVTLDEADSAVKAHLERIKAYLGDHQWDEAVETLRQVMENHGGRMVPLTPTRYVNLTDYCHVQIAALPAEALALYRERVDSLAEKWYGDGLSQHNAARLADVVDQMLCSSWGDDALFALGEIELEHGHFGLARRHWERIIETPPARVAASRFQSARQLPDLPQADADLVDHWYAPDATTAPKWYLLRNDEVLDDATAGELVRFWKSRNYAFTRLSYPGTNLPLADVRARLILVSILEGSLTRARDELRAFGSLHGEAEGRLAGKQVKYADALAAMIDAAENWPPPKTTTDWSTFAGSESRSKVAVGNLDLGAPAWIPIQLGKPLAADAANARVFSLRRVAEDGQRLLSYHPVVVGDLVLVNNQDQIFAFNLQTGKPAWPGDDLQRASGEIFRDDSAPVPTNRIMNRGLGAPRFTMTVHGDKLFARMGSPITSRPLEALEGRSGYLVCLDLAAQGRLVWRLPDKTPGADQEWASDEKWAFEGSPVVDGSDVYVAMRKSDVRPQSHVACFDLETRRLRWRTFVCAAETPGGGQRDEITHNLLTLEDGVLYCNTNLGAVAAISARDGRLQWATLYPRARSTESDGQDKRAAHFYRDLNPCVYYRGLLLVAPSDSEAIFALAADNGESIWESYLPEDAVHLLGVGHGNLLASGDSLWWIDARQGKVLRRWPGTSPLGYGRGILVGDQVVWPTRDALYVFDQEIREQPAAVAARDPILLAEERDAGGGNLVASGDVLVIAASDRLYGFRQAGRAPAAKAAAADAPGGADARNGNFSRDVATD